LSEQASSYLVYLRSKALFIRTRSKTKHCL